MRRFYSLFSTVVEFLQALDDSVSLESIELMTLMVIVNVYKLPPTRLRSLDLPVFPHPFLYAGDFNYHHADWGYDDNSPDGEYLAVWASINCLALLYIMPRMPPVFTPTAGTLAPIQI